MRSPPHRATLLISPARGPGETGQMGRESKGGSSQHSARRFRNSGVAMPRRCGAAPRARRHSGADADAGSCPFICEG